MKKKLLFLILLLIPFIVKADDLNLLKAWDVKSESTFEKTVIGPTNYVKYSYNDGSVGDGFASLTSVNKLTGETKTISIGDFEHKIFLNDSNLIVVRFGENKEASVTTYDENLNIISSEALGVLDLNYCINDNNYLFITGNKLIDGDYYRYIYYFNPDGTLYKQDSINTINATRTSRTLAGFSFEDMYNNTYDINDYKLVPRTLLNNNYYVSTGNKIVKFNNAKEKVDEVDIPVGKAAKIIKNNNSFYVMSAIFTQGGLIKYQIVLYTMDANLNLSTPADPYPTTAISSSQYEEDSFLYDVFRFYNIDNRIYISLSKPIGIGQGLFFYTIGADLSLTETNELNPEDFYNDNQIYDEGSLVFAESSNTPNSLKNYYAFNGGVSNIDSEIAEFSQIVSSIEQHLSENSNSVYSITKKDLEDGSSVYSILYGASDNPNSLGITKLKLELLYIDNNNQKVFSKIIYDWTTFNEMTCNNKLYSSGANVFNDYIVLATNAKNKNIIKFYDKQGNEVLDLSEDVDKYRNLTFVNMIPYKDGIYFEYTERYIACDQGVSEVVNPNVLGATNVRTYMVYYEIPFLVNTKVTGKGTVTAKQIKALSGSSVEFTVTPEPGYVLSYVKVTDSKGNVLTFTNNTFVMPSADVTIEAIFVPYNPNTGNIAIITIGILAIASFAMVIYEKRKVNALK